MAVKVTNYNIAIVALVCLGGYSFGYGFAVFSTSIGIGQFYVDMGLDPTSDYTANILGATNSLFAAGAAFGSIAQGWVGDWLGRKVALLVATVWCLVGSILVAGSINVPMLITCRIIQGVGVGMTLVLTPVYITEVSPKEHRGKFTGCTAGSFAVGYIVSSWVGYGCYFAKNQVLAWRLPLALAPITSVILLCGIKWMPESPRYLSWVGRNEEAWAIIEKLHYDPDDLTQAAAHAEYTQIKKQVEFDKGQATGYIAMFKKPSWRRRCFLAMGLVFAMQSCGPFGVTNYIVLITKTLGLTGSLPVLMYAMYIIVAASSNFIGASLTDKLGRRPIFLFGFPACSLCLLSEALLQRSFVGTDNKAGNAAALLFIFVYAVCYGVMDPVQFTWCSEIFPTTIRAKGVALSCFSYFCGVILWTTPSPLAFRVIQYKYFFVWVGCSLVSWVGVYFFIFETKGISLEEMGGKFGEEVVIHLTADGRGVIESEEGFVEVPVGPESISSINDGKVATATEERKESV